jgi:hypothetical protein
VTVLTLLLVVFNAATLEVSGEAQAAREQSSRRRIDADYTAVTAAHPGMAVLQAPADPHWAPDLTGSDLRQLVRWGQFSPNS